ncbi:N-acetyl-gamma-glutamyl-phosphate reductase [Bacillus sp. FJAT-42376]|uniref:N-acetyl-gamma-glutamyl-phosphate reductase n=1 Tax=Bacillus sp. FJAT-42376 TaxID=2014076 RepID=UPI000F516F12|nr:N-acetyl-gamma-glutamyl-phosphate reductase [Bacillus sp. FJAT-42376]AZB42340.1 N-acetyl-gamma-glutamyl-phosphate reductase [Bacillus sp. FJAT-42376]
MNVGIVGSTGYGGIELYRLLANHPYTDKCILYTSSQGGNLYSDVYPHLNGLMDEPLENADEAEGIDVMFLAAPPGVSAELTPSLMNKGCKVIDLSGDLRLKAPGDYEKWYQRKPAAKELIGEAVYGLTEINRERIADTNILSNPGCYPTASLLGLAPLVLRHRIEPASIIIDAKSGISGAGRKAGLGTHYSELNENFKVYKIAEHQHTPEIEQQLGIWMKEPVRISFTPHLVPMTRGIMATMYVQLSESVSTETLLESYQSFYEDAPFVRIRKPGTYPQTKEVAGSNFCDIGLKVDERTGRVVIASVIDNLMKGAAGQAVQNYNVMNGWDERAGLKLVPMYP